ncbi:glycoside hydrolase [Jimgerdemannia flammicorona]|uniref:Mannosyl-oligosaccharide glucosidase n=1 Tax=Jimgerdemannia flammicorona TaxID=994334 RepID=A0A433Q8F5_9FUNG|nr:glycoside hydrolase [Jimgerdemannia flammicorona]
MRWPIFLLTAALLHTAHTADPSDAAPDIAQLSVLASQAANASLLWGTYRPNLYFGTRPRLPESLMTGLMWFNADTIEGYKNIRHACDQGDNLAGYGYHKHDGRSFAMQRIRDEHNNVVITTEFIKVPGGKHGGEWGVRIKGKPDSEGVPTTAVLFYVGVEGDGGIDLMNKLDKQGLLSPVKFEGDTPDLGDFSIQIVDGKKMRMYMVSYIRIVILNLPSPSGLLNNVPESNPLDVDLSRTHFWGTPVSDGDIWRAKDFVAEHIVNSANAKISQYEQEDITAGINALFTLNNVVRDEDAANFYVVQKVYRGAFQFDVFFRSDSASTHIDAQTFTSRLDASSAAFDARFERTFGLDAKGYNAEQVEFARYLLSNLIGGIGYAAVSSRLLILLCFGFCISVFVYKVGLVGLYKFKHNSYFYGSSIVDHAAAEYEESGEPQLTAPKLTSPGILFTATPSRPFFPRGFYWDEGFHQLLIGQWDNDLSLDIIKYWVTLIDEDGWVAREQILGAEARSKVPAEFQTQYPHYANPPTLLMAIRAFIDRLDASSGHHHDHPNSPISAGQQYAFAAFDDQTLLPDHHLLNPGLGMAYLEAIYPKLRLNWEWFRRTQKGEVKEWGRKARSREAYRWRGRTPEHTLTSGLDDYPRANPPNIAELHLDLISWMGFSTRLLKSIASRLGEAYEDDVSEYDKVERNILNNIEDLHWSEKNGMYCDVSIDVNDDSVHICHKGYLTLFPFLLGHLPPDHPHLEALFDLIRDEEELWSAFGLRSLTKSDPFYGTGEVYWRGPVWINVNYMALASLYKNYVNQPGPYQEKAKNIYKELRENVIGNVYKEYRRTGYVWEQYSPLTGEGQRSHPFTGWTSLILLIMAEKY